MAQWPEAGWYVESGGTVPRWWDGTAWGVYYQTPVPAVVAPTPVQVPAMAPAMHPGSADPWFANVPNPAPSMALRDLPRGFLVAGAAVVALLLVVGIVVLRHGSASASAWAAGGPANGPATFTLSHAPTPPAGFKGQSSVFSAAGTGPATTPEFTLRGGSLLGSMDQSGSGVYFVLVPSDGGATTPLGNCTGQCASGGWATNKPIPAGTYRMQVTADSSTHWSFEMLELYGYPSS